ncbi:T9SS type A sorting domain-containing protein [Chryseobacterium sp. VD8]|uniref:T9SS type A sorting domain-containing protein n=1 Tax=Chryseobacterium sp. VD8 TaxID=3081254 RepID=UPI0030161F8D
MNKNLFFLAIFISCFLSAQADLYNTNWYLRKVVKNNITYNVPQNIEISVPILTFNDQNTTSTNLSSSVCEQSIWGTINNFDITVNNFSFWTYGVGNGNNCTLPENITFSSIYTGYFSQYSPLHSYQITYTGNIKNLILTNYLGDQAFYQSGTLSSNDINQTSEKNILIYPNPANEYLVIKSKDQIECVKIYNSEGKLILQNKYETKTDISALLKGSYFLELASKNGISRHKFIKE